MEANQITSLKMVNKFLSYGNLILKHLENTYKKYVCQEKKYFWQKSVCRQAHKN